MNCRFVGNETGLADRGDVRLDNCVFDGNLGGAMNSYLSTPVLTNCIFVRNKGVDGAGVYNFYSHSVLLNCLFAGNVARRGGAIYDSISGYSSLINCTVVANRGGGIATEQGIPAETPRTRGTMPEVVSAKSPAQYHIGDPIVANSVFWANAIGGMVAQWTQLDVSSIDHSCVQGWTGWLGGTGNISSDPCFVQPGHWDPNGTPDDPNDDFWIDGDYHLKSQGGRWEPSSRIWIIDDITSPCIDAGDPMSPVGHEPFPNGGRINMGAYGGTAEASKSYFGEPVCETIMPGDLNGDCRVDFVDLGLLGLHWLEDNTPVNSNSTIRYGN